MLKQQLLIVDPQNELKFRGMFFPSKSQNFSKNKTNKTSEKK